LLIRLLGRLSLHRQGASKAKQADCQSAAGYQPAPQHAGGVVV
jgi:hypothetical protein